MSLLEILPVHGEVADAQRLTEGGRGSARPLAGGAQPTAPSVSPSGCHLPTGGEDLS